MFSILDSVDSTNNYAMAMVHAGMAKHAMAWFAHEQTTGRGQRQKSWESAAGQNIALSIAVKPPAVFFGKQFYFSVIIANACYAFFKKYAGDETSIKWPNDIYWRDRKAGGILIENKLSVKDWKWAVIGIGININQTAFDKSLVNPVSLKQITGKSHDPLTLANELYEHIMAAVDSTEISLVNSLQHYNDCLFQMGKTVRLKKENMVFETRIKGVNGFGQLLTEDTIERQFNFGEIEWVF